MCGRFVATSSRAELQAEFAAAHVVGPDPRPSWNVAPTQQVRIVAERLAEPTDDAPRREIFTASWGLVPHWAKDRSIGTRMINARSETVAEKPAFRAAAVRRRCLVPADGYYEWMPTAGRKIPYFLHAPDDGILAMAGLYEVWRDPEVQGDNDAAALVWTCTVITRAAPDALGHIHDRSPVIVPRLLWSEWLDCVGSNKGDVGALLAEIPSPQLVPREVGPLVGNVRNNSPALIEPARPAPGPEQMF